MTDRAVSLKATVPCPFCGGRTIVFGKSGGRSFLECDDCHARGPSIVAANKFVGARAQEAADNYLTSAWNGRFEP